MKRIIFLLLPIQAAQATVSPQDHFEQIDNSSARQEITPSSQSSSALRKKVGEEAPKLKPEILENRAFAESAETFFRAGSDIPQVCATLNALGPNLFGDDAFFQTLTVLAKLVPPEYYHELIKLISGLKPEVYRSENFRLVLPKALTNLSIIITYDDTGVGKLSESDQYDKQRKIILALGELEPSALNDKDVIKILSKMLSATTRIAERLDLIRIINHLDPVFYRAPFVEDLISFIKTHQNRMDQDDLLRLFFDKKLQQNVFSAQNELGQTQYQEVLASDLSLLEQITDGPFLGVRARLPLFKPKRDDRNYLAACGDNFSDELDLGHEIKQYCDEKGRPGDALYRYSIYENSQSSPKGVIINYYGGFAGDKSFDTGQLRQSDKLYVVNGYTVIEFQTRDNWQTISQRDQFRTLDGKELLQDTLVGLLLFVKAIKARYPTLPIYYNGASFGGTEGALINLILSNKGSLSEIFTSKLQETAEELENFLTQYEIDPFLFQGFILHDGGYHYLFPINQLIRRYYTKIPMLLLQNFDDQRVGVTQTLYLYDLLKQGGSSARNLRLLVTPQGAPSFLQKVTPFAPTSLDGHHLPEVAKYREDYNGSVLNFLENPQGVPKLTAVLNSVRHTHSQDLFDSGTQERTHLYRLYHANIRDEVLFHAEAETDRRPKGLIRRLNKTFSQYARYLAQKGGRTPGLEYRYLVRTHGFWLIAKVLGRFKNIVRAVLASTKIKERDVALLPEGSRSSKSTLETAPSSGETSLALAVPSWDVTASSVSPSLRAASPSVSPASPSLPPAPPSLEVAVSSLDADGPRHDLSRRKPDYQHFYLTPDARDYLASRRDAQRLIEQARQYSLPIDRRVLEFFASGPDLPLSLAAVKILWGTPDFPTVRRLPYASRVFSLVTQVETIRQDERTKLLLLLLPYQAEDILLALGNKELTLRNYAQLAAGLATKSDGSEQRSIIGCLKDLFPAIEEGEEIIDWVLRLSKKHRKKIVDKYLVIQTLLHKKGIPPREVLALFRTAREQDVLGIIIEKDVSGFMKSMEQLSVTTGDKEALFLRLIAPFAQSSPLPPEAR